MAEQEIVTCPSCKQKLGVPSNLGRLKVKCPACNLQFFVHGKLVWTADLREIASIISSKKRRNKLKNIGIAAVIIVLVFFALYYFKNTSKEQLIPSARLIKSNWITISYGDLLDESAIIRTGQTLKSALGDPNLRGAVQQFIDRYSYLLAHSIEMIVGPDELPYHNVVDHYPVGSKQPAWIGIFRGGRVLITTDNKDHAKVFLIGENPKNAYEDNYSVIRHCLSGLLPKDGSELTVQIFAYKNDYQRSEFKLNLDPYILKSSTFPSPTEVIPLDLDGIRDFFQNGGQLEGAALDKNDGLILFAKEGSKQTLAGYDVELSDFAVAYRAALHAGDNEAFISLDPHIDPTQVTVNFGGFLEDTRLGAVVLESDKRFKTITCGLDPHSFKDIRGYTRRFVPTFLTAFERELLTEKSTSQTGWIGTRFWFYPDSIEVQSDLDYLYARITKPQFTADAERSRDDFVSPEEFEMKKKETLSLSIRQCISHLNQNYLKYEKSFPEIRELTIVARLLGICSWLQRANCDWVDLDALLSVDLPAFRTEREKTQLLAVSYVSHIEGENLDEDYIRRNSNVVFLSPFLDKTVKDYFSNSTNLAKFLCHKNDFDEDLYTVFKPEADLLFSSYQDKKVRQIIKTEKDLKAFAAYAVNNIEIKQPMIINEYTSNLSYYEKELNRLEAEINQVEIKMEKAATMHTYNDYVNKYNRLVAQYESIRSKYNSNLNAYNKLNLAFPLLLEISGGINLESKYFNIKRTTNSPQLQRFKSIIGKAEPKWKEILDSGKWIKSRAKYSLPYRNPFPKYNWVIKNAFKSNGLDLKYLSDGKERNYWVSMDINTGFWRDMIESEKGGICERLYNSSEKILHVAEYKSEKLKNYIVGERMSENKIVFRKSKRQDLLKPARPPIWWENK